jgi:hypothetical protein
VGGRGGADGQGSWAVGINKGGWECPEASEHIFLYSNCRNITLYASILLFQVPSPQILGVARVPFKSERSNYAFADILNHTLYDGAMFLPVLVCRPAVVCPAGPHGRGLRLFKCGVLRGGSERKPAQPSVCPNANYITLHAVELGARMGDGGRAVRRLQDAPSPSVLRFRACTGACDALQTRRIITQRR